MKDLAQKIERIKDSEEPKNFGKRKARKKSGAVQYDPITPTEHSAEETKLATNQTAKMMIENDIKP